MEARRPPMEQRNYFRLCCVCVCVCLCAFKFNPSAVGRSRRNVFGRQAATALETVVCLKHRREHRDSS